MDETETFFMADCITITLDKNMCSDLQSVSSLPSVSNSIALTKLASRLPTLTGVPLESSDSCLCRKTYQNQDRAA